MFVKTNLQDDVWKICLSRSDCGNAFSPKMIEQITQSFQTVPANARAVYLCSEGRHFCLGADLEWMKSTASYSEQQNLEDSERLFEMFKAILQTSVPVVAKVHGSVYGGGLGLVVASDFVIAHDTAHFCFSEVRLGLIPAVISSFVLSKINLGLAQALMISGMTFSSIDAVHAGLVHKIGDERQCEKDLSDVLDQIKKNGPEATRKTKSLVRQIFPIQIGEWKKLTTLAIAQQRVSVEGQQGLQAFLNKTVPPWTTP